jgi:hypothetical protein
MGLRGVKMTLGRRHPVVRMQQQEKVAPLPAAHNLLDAACESC